MFAWEVEAHAQPGGVSLALCTSGNSPNVVKALEAARARGMATIGLTGEECGRMAPLRDHLFTVPTATTPAMQKLHRSLYRCFCPDGGAA